MIFALRRTRAGWALMLVLAALLVVPFTAAAQDGTQADEIVSRVNDEPIRRDSFHTRLRFIRWQYLNELEKLYELTGGNLGLADEYVTYLITNIQNPDVLGDAMLSQMEEERLLWQTAAELGLAPTAEDVQEREAEFFSLWTDVPAEQVPGDADAQAFIAAWYEEAIDISGMSEDDIRDVFAADALNDVLFDYLSASVPAEEIAVHTRHILCSFHPFNLSDTTPPTDDERLSAELCIQAASNRLAGGEPFAFVAADLSDDQYSASAGGDLGTVLISYLTGSYADAVRDAELNTVIGPVETEYGLHLIEVLAREMQPLTADELADAQAGYFELWLDTLVAEATIKRSDDWADDLPADPDLGTLDSTIQDALQARTGQTGQTPVGRCRWEIDRWLTV